MKPFVSLLITAATLVTTTASAVEPTIVEASSIREISSSIRPDSVVIFDLDNTVMETRQALGSDSFFGWLVERANQEGLGAAEAKARALEQNALVQPFSAVRAVERETSRLIRRLQRSGHIVFALTARPEPWAFGTLRQLDSLGIDFELTSPASPIAKGRRMGKIVRGVFFVDPSASKGPALVEYFADAKLTPRHVVFIDDKRKNTESVSGSLAVAGIEHVSFRYGAADEDVRRFRPDLAEIEWNYFLKCRRFLSDGAAEKSKSTPIANCRR